VTTEDRYIAIERDINRIAERVQELMLAVDASEWGDGHDSLFLGLKQRVSSLEKAIEALVTKIEIAKSIHDTVR